MVYSSLLHLAASCDRREYHYQINISDCFPNHMEGIIARGYYLGSCSGCGLEVYFSRFLCNGLGWRWEGLRVK